MRDLIAALSCMIFCSDCESENLSNCSASYLWCFFYLIFTAGPHQVCSTPEGLVKAMQNLDVSELRPYIKPGTSAATAAAGIVAEITRVVGFAPKD